MTPHPPTPPHDCFLEHPNTPCPTYPTQVATHDGLSALEWSLRFAREHERAEHAEQRVAALVNYIEESTFCECFDEYGRKRPTSCDRCVILSPLPTPPTGGRT